MNKEDRINQLALDMDYGCTKRDLYPDDAKEIAKALDILGYRRVVWHKVADGDLPKKYKEVLFLDENYEYYIGSYAKDEESFHTDIGFDMGKNKVIAWTELPKYGE